MTLLKKLLPVASIAAAAAVVAPIVTSCAAGGSISFDPTVEPDVTGWKKSIKEEQTSEQATIEYAAAVKDDINTLKNDYRFGSSFACKFIEINEKRNEFMKQPNNQIDFIWESPRCTLSNLSISENGAFDSITFKSDINLNITFISIKPTGQGVVTKTNVHLKMDALNVPFLITPGKSFMITEIPCFSLPFGDFYNEDLFKTLDKEWHANASFYMSQEESDYVTGRVTTPREEANIQWTVNKDNIINIYYEMMMSYVTYLYSWPTYFFLGTQVTI